MKAGESANGRRTCSRHTEKGSACLKGTKLLYPNGVPDDVIEATAGKLGASLPQCRNLTDDGRVKGLKRSAAVRKAAAVSAFADLVPFMTELRTEGLSLHAIAERLNADGQSTRRGSTWSATQVKRVLDRAATKA